MCGIAILAVALGAAAEPGLSAAAPAGELTVSAAASLADAFRLIGQAFEQRHPRLTVRFNFAASGILLQQVARGAPVDVLVTADVLTMQRGVERGLVDPASRREFAANSLVLIEPLRRRTGVKPLESLEDLRSEGVARIAIGKPEVVPVGSYARQALQAAGLWDIVQPKLIPADSTRQVLDYVGRGEVSAGFVYATDAALSEQVRVVLMTQQHEPIRYPAAVVRDSRRGELALDFVRFLQLPVAQAILRRHGFGPP